MSPTIFPPLNNHPVYTGAPLAAALEPDLDINCSSFQPPRDSFKHFKWVSDLTFRR